MASLFGSTSNQSQANSGQGDLSKDVEVKDIQAECISGISFSPTSDHLAVSSWNGEVRIFEIDGSGNSQGRAIFKTTNQKPMLNCCWSPDGAVVFGAGADNALHAFDVASQQTKVIQAHSEPIPSVVSTNQCPNAGSLAVTGSWDKTIKYWDVRQQNAIGSIDCQNKIYSLSTKDKLLVAGTADRYINIIELTNPGRFYKTMQSPLKWQTRVVSCFTDATGFAIGSIEGRCAIQYVEEKDASMNFSFKCHRDTPTNPPNVSNVYAVNDISFHPVHGTFSTAGSDGTFHFWDGVAKHRLKGYPTVGQSITSTDFNRSGNIFAYACSYDWSKGLIGSQQGAQNRVMLHPVSGDECTRKNKGKR